MPWELGSLAAATIVRDEETRGKVLGAAGGHCTSPLPSSPGTYGSGHHKKYCGGMAALVLLLDLRDASLECFIDL